MLSDGEIIEEYVARTFPAVTERQLIQATRNLERESYLPGSIIVREGMSPDRFYIITKGQIEVLVEASDGERLVVARMGRGQYFGEIELLRGGTNIATIRAAPETGVEVAALNRETFQELLATSATAREALGRVAEERIAENVNGRDGAHHA
ncbi:MAG: cyclic nucleotide-binding domain-containing protein [Anaerolineae bacterium]